MFIVFMKEENFSSAFSCNAQRLLESSLDMCSILLTYERINYFWLLDIRGIDGCKRVEPQESKKMSENPKCLNPRRSITDNIRVMIFTNFFLWVSRVISNSTGPLKNLTKSPSFVLMFPELYLYVFCRIIYNYLSMIYDFKYDEWFMIKIIFR